MIQYPAITNPVPTEIRTITSAYVQQEYQLFISLPASYAASDKIFPVLYLLDGNATYTMVRPPVETLQIIQLVPELIIVGIGYPQATYMDTLALRGRDLTPIELPPEQKAGDGYPFEETGGASRFLSFLAHELIPFIDQNFRTDPNNRALLGWSLGGAFVLYTLFEQPDLFKRLIAVSPSIDMLNRDNQFKESLPLPVKLYWGIEAPADNLQILKEIELHRQFVTDIRERNHEGLEVHFQIYEGEDHFSIGIIGSIHGLRAVYR